MAKRRKKLRTRNNTGKQDVWWNEDKGQMSLEIGSDEYDERQRDLKEHDPFKPDDEENEQLEEHNAEHAKSLDVNVERNRRSNDAAKKKAMKQMAKRVQFDRAKKTAIQVAKLTETMEDDKLAKKLKPKDLESQVYDDSVSADEFIPKALSKYLGE